MSLRSSQEYSGKRGTPEISYAGEIFPLVSIKRERMPSKKAFLDWLVFVRVMSVASIAMILLIALIAGPMLNFLLYGIPMAYPFLGKVIGLFGPGIQMGVFSGTVLWCANRYFW